MSAARTTVRLAVAVLGAALLLAVAAPAASAQDPYGSTSTTAPRGPSDPRGEIEATCGLSIPQGRPGDTVTATVHNVFFGERVAIFFDNIEVASTRAPEFAAASVGGPVLLGGAALPAQAAVTSVQVTFTIPPAAAGTHIVTAVGDTFTCFCNPDGQFKVLGAGSGLPRTGVYAGVLVAVALALLVAGRVLVSVSRRRRAAGIDPFLDPEVEARDHQLAGRR